MLEKCKNAKERWGGVSDLIDQWLEQRQLLIRTFVALPDCEIGAPLNATLTEFCDLLMDYLSSGHFEVYEHLLREGSEFADGSVEKAQALFPLIQPSTDSALDFNDRYGVFEQPTLREIRDFASQLSQLGEALEERFEIEDRMIATLHDAHRTLVSEA